MRTHRQQQKLSYETFRSVLNELAEPSCYTAGAASTKPATIFRRLSGAITAKSVPPRYMLAITEAPRQWSRLDAASTSAKPVADPSHTRAERQRRREVGNLRLAELQLGRKHPLDRRLRSAPRAYGPPVEGVPLPPVLEHVVRPWREPLEKLCSVRRRVSAHQGVQTA